MSGRGFPLKFKKKEDESSLASSISSMNFAGRGGRGFSIQSLASSLPRKTEIPKESAENKEAHMLSEKQFEDAETGTVDKQCNQSSAISVVSSSTSFLSKVRGRGVIAGRGMLANQRMESISTKTPSVVSTLNATTLISDTLESGSSSALAVKDKALPKTASTGLGTSLNSRPSASSGATPEVTQNTSAVPVSQKTVETEPIQKKHGSHGKDCQVMTNAIKINCDPETGVFEYEVRFSPVVDNVIYRSKYLREHKEILGGDVRSETYDGSSNLYLPKRLPDSITRLTSKSLADQTDVTIELIYKRQKKLSECVQLFNILFERVFKALSYLRVGKKSYNPNDPQLIKQHKLELWPGYVKSAEVMEGGLYLTLDISNRVLSSKTVLEEMQSAFVSNPSKYKENITKSLLGKIVLTRYNNKSYRIDEIGFDLSPQNTFKRGESDVTYEDYYKQQYGLSIRDPKQNLLISRKEVLISGEPEKRSYMFCLVPELCFLTGLTDNQKGNFNVLKDMACFTKVKPFNRLASYKKFLENVDSTPAAKNILSQWGLSLESEPEKVVARVLDEQMVFFKKKLEMGVGKFADFSKYIATNEVIDAIDLNTWLLVYVESNLKEAEAFERTLGQICGPTGIRVTRARHVVLKNDRNNTFTEEIVKAVRNETYQMIVVIVPSLRDDRYAAIKRLLCVENPCPSQVIIAKTLKNETKNRSIVLKIILQMNCKMGGTLWGVKIPLKHTMICGIDTYHEVGPKGITVGGFVASLNPEFTRWYSNPTIQQKREELVNGLTSSMESALVTYFKMNNMYPDTIIIYRDGVSDGQLSFVKSYEIPQFKEAFKRVAVNYDPKLTFIIVQKRINAKFYKMVPGRKGPESLENPPPGSILDHTVTSAFLYDFFVISQHVREGTTAPSHYIVLEDEKPHTADALQRLTYKLCFLYYNWPGTVRVPAPCQYAHKLADLVGMSIKRKPSEELADKLYFL